MVQWHVHCVIATRTINLVQRFIRNDDQKTIKEPAQTSGLRMILAPSLGGGGKIIHQLKGNGVLAGYGDETNLGTGWVVGELGPDRMRWRLIERREHLHRQRLRLGRGNGWRLESGLRRHDLQRRTSVLSRLRGSWHVRRPRNVVSRLQLPEYERQRRDIKQRG